MEKLPPLAPRGLSRLSKTNSAHEPPLEAVFQASADLRGPLSTIPDSPHAASEGNATPMSDAFEMPESRETTATSWDRYFDEAHCIHLDSRGGDFRLYIAGRSGPLLYCLHGGGYTGLTWALLAARLKDSCRVAALDMRGHGETSTSDDAALSADILSQDAVAVWQQVFGEEAPPTVLIGHSMGGAVAVRAASSQGIRSLEGLVVIDVVEGTALAALPHMRVVLQNRPPSFPSLGAALAWAHRTGMSRNAEAAAVSLPSQLRREVAVDRERWVWRTALEPSAPYWDGWYRGLSEAFLGVKLPKVLLLAGTDRLDRTLTIGQMQGRFQMILLPKAGHAVHEDEVERTAEVLSAFLKRFRIGAPKAQIPTPSGAPVVLPIPAGPLFPAER